MGISKSVEGEQSTDQVSVQVIVTDSSELTLEEVHRVVYGGAQVALSETGVRNLARSRELLDSHAQESIVYGLNTGFGPMANCRIPETSQRELQFNLIRSHAMGSGKRIPDLFVGATMLCRLVSFMKGYSGVSDDLVHLLVAFLNHRIYPVIPEHGGVGASGDLVQLAHVGLALIGEGQSVLDGEVMPTKEAMTRFGLTALELVGRDGLAILNGVSVMTGIGLVNVFEAERLLSWAVAASALLMEVIECPRDPIHPELNHRKQHPGQQSIASTMETLLHDSECMRPNCMPLESMSNENGKLRNNVQENYSVRCVPQILGPILDTITYARSVVSNELNSVSDNPVLCPDSGMILHGGNFHGDYVALEMDKLKISIVKLSMLCERQLDYLMNDGLNNRFPPFMNLGTLGLNLGMQGAQFTATSTAAENQSLAFPMYVHSIPTNRGNQDIVSMGTNAALMANCVIQNSFEILAIEFVALLQAVDHAQCEEKLSTCSRETYRILRGIVPLFREDSLRTEQIDALRSYLKGNRALTIESGSFS